MEDDTGYLKSIGSWEYWGEEMNCLLYKIALPHGRVGGKLGQRERTGWVHSWARETKQNCPGILKPRAQHADSWVRSCGLKGRRCSGRPLQLLHTEASDVSEQKQQ